MMHTETVTHNLIVDPSYRGNDEMRSEVIAWGAEQARNVYFNRFPGAAVKVVDTRSLGFDQGNYEMVEFTLEVSMDIPDEAPVEEAITEEIPSTDE